MLSKSVKKLSIMVAILLFSSSLIACMKPSVTSAGTEAATTESTAASSSTDEQTLTVWLSAAFVNEIEQKSAQEDWVISGIIRDFEAQNPGVKVELTILADQSAAHQTFKAAAMSESGPDIINLWAGQPIFALKDVLLDLTPYVPQDDLDNIISWEAVRDGFSADGAILAYPTQGSDACGFLYNRAVLKSVGLDFDTNPPKTLDAFLAALETIKAAGITPITADDQGFNSLLTLSLASWWVQMVGSETIANESLGLQKFADDANFLAVIKTISTMYANGYINVDYSSSQDSFTRFVKGEAALMGGIGTNYVTLARNAMNPADVGYLNPPDFSSDALVKDTAIGGTGQCLAVARYTKNPELAVKFISFLDNKENQLKLLKMYPMLPIRSDITVSDLGWDNDAELKKAFEVGQRYSYWSDNSMVPDVASEYYSLGTLAVTGKITPEEYAAKLDEKAAELQQ